MPSLSGESGHGRAIGTISTFHFSLPKSRTEQGESARGQVWRFAPYQELRQSTRLPRSTAYKPIGRCCWYRFASRINSHTATVAT
jgi:hypothetical protein